MAKFQPNAQQRNQFDRDWGNYALVADLPNAAGWTGLDTYSLEEGDSAFVLGVGPVYCVSAGTPGLLDATWAAVASGGPPSGPAGGDLTGTYPNPSVAALAITAAKIALATITDAQVAAANIDGASATPSLRTLGSGAAQACAGNDPRLSDPRSPTGAAGGDLGGSYPTPTVIQARGLRETSGPTTLVMGAVADGQLFARSGATVVGVPVPSSGITELTGDATAGPGSGSQAVTVVQARGLRETSGPTTLVMGAVADGEYLRRVGSTVVGASSGGGITIRDAQLNAMMFS